MTLSTHTTFRSSADDSNHCSESPSNRVANHDASTLGLTSFATVALLTLGTLLSVVPDARAEIRDGASGPPPVVTEEAFPGRQGIPGKAILIEADGSQGQVIDYEMIDGEAIFQGDIVLNVDERGFAAFQRQRLDHDGAGHGDKSAGRTSYDKLWPGNVVYYELSSSLSSQYVGWIEDAIAHWEQETEIILSERTDEPDYLYFTSTSGCSSYVGRQGGKQTVKTTGCSVAGSVIHEIGHAVGLYHEHTRADRDQYVSIVYSKIQSGQASNFYQYTASDGEDLTTYDPDSIMHYPCWGFTTGTWYDDSDRTIVPDSSSWCDRMGQRNALSSKDVEGIDQLYSSNFYALYETPDGTEPALPLISRGWPSNNVMAATIDLAAVDHDGDGVDEIAVLIGDDNIQTVRVYEADADFTTDAPVGMWMTLFNDAFAIAGVDHDGDGVDEIALLFDNGGDLNLHLYDSPVGFALPVVVGSNYWSLPDGGSVDIAGVDHDGDGVDEIAVLKYEDGDPNLYIYEAPIGTQNTALVGTNKWSLPDQGGFAIAGIDVDGDGVDEIGVLKIQFNFPTIDTNFYIYEAPVGTQDTALVATDHWNIPDRGAFTIAGVDHDGDGVDDVAVVKD